MANRCRNVSRLASRHDSATRGQGRLRIIETLGWTDTTIDYPVAARNLCWLADSRAFLFTLGGAGSADEDARCIHAVRLTKPYPSLAHGFERPEPVPEKTFEISGETVR